MTKIEKGDPVFDAVRSAVVALLEAMQAHGAVEGSAGMFKADGACVIVATGSSADDWEEIYQEWEVVNLEDEED